MSDKKEKYVYKRSDGRWEARYVKGCSESGKPVYGVLYGKSEAEVIKKRHELIGTPEDSAKVPNKLNLLILGAGSHGRNIKEIAESLRIFNKVSFLDDKKTGEDIIGKCGEALRFRNEYVCAFVAIGDNKRRKRYAKFLKERNFLMPNIISPSATISPNVVLGEGIAILPQCTVNESEIGDFCILSSNTLINNEAKIGSFSHIGCGGIVPKGKKVPELTWVKDGVIYGKSKESDGNE